MASMCILFSHFVATIYVSVENLCISYAFFIVGKFSYSYFFPNVLKIFDAFDYLKNIITKHSSDADI